jgi:hypothetical protein
VLPLIPLLTELRQVAHRAERRVGYLPEGPAALSLPLWRVEGKRPYPVMSIKALIPRMRCTLWHLSRGGFWPSVCDWEVGTGDA